MSSRIFATALLLVACFCTTARAGVTFFFDYSDPSNTTDFGMGAFFDGSPMGMARKAALAATASEIGASLGHTATVKVYVNTIFSPSGPLASGGGTYYVPPTASGVVISSMQKTVIMGTPIAPDEYHATLTWNAAKPFYTGIAPTVTPSGYFDFRSVAWHELTHALGWQSALKPGSGGIESSLTDVLMASDPSGYAGLGELWTTYDTLLVDSEGHPAILSGSINPAFVPMDGVDLAGPHVLGLGDPLPTDVTPFPPSFDTTHMLGSVDSIMVDSLGAGVVKRGWTGIDKAVLADLGYTIVTPIPEPSSFVLLGLAVTVGLSGWRRAKRG